jgi:DNA invertase Pin-like site-specific DNA recombinase
MKLFLARVSTKKQKDEGYSIEAQLEKGERYAKKKKITYDRTFKIDETAAVAEERQDFGEVMGIIKNGEEHELYVEKTDRLLRNDDDAYEIDKLVKAGKLVIHFIDENLVYDRNANSHNKLMFRFKSILAKFYIELMAEESQKSVKQKLQRGEFPGVAPIGYTNNTKLHTIEIDEERAPKVAEAYQLFATGEFSLKTITREMMNRGLRTRPKESDGVGHPLGKDSIRWMLKNPFYYGRFPWGGKEYDNKDTYEPIVSKSLYLRVQEVLKRNRQNPSSERGKDHLFKSIIECSNCGRSYLGEVGTWKNKKTGEERSVTYYHCTKCSKDEMPRFKEADLEYLFFFDLAEFLPDEEVMKKLSKELGVLIEVARSRVRNEVKYCRTRITTLEQKIDRLYENLDENKIKQETYDRLYEKYNEELANTKEQLRANEAAREENLENAVENIELCKSFEERYLEANPEKKNRMLKFIYRKVLAQKSKEKKPCGEWLLFERNEIFSEISMRYLAEKSKNFKAEFPQNLKRGGRLI